MIQGTKNYKLSEGTQKLPEKSVSPKLHKNMKTVPEKTKFTLQYNTISNQTLKSTDKKGVRSLTPQGSRTHHSLRLNLTAPGANDPAQTVRDQKLSQSDSKQTHLSDERKISSSPFITNAVTDSKGNADNADVRKRLPKTFIGSKIPTNSKNNLLPVKHSPFQCKPEMKLSTSKTENSKKWIAQNTRVKDLDKTTKNTHSVWKKACTGAIQSTSCVKQAESDDKTGNVSPDRARKKYLDEEGKLMAKERSRSQEVKRITSKESSVKIGVIAQRKRSEGKIFFNGLKKIPFTGLNDRNWDIGNVGLDLRENTLVSSSSNPSKACLVVSKENVIAVHGPDPNNVLNSKNKANIIGVTDTDDNLNIFENSVKDYDVFESLERKHRDEKLLNLDKRIWSNLEMEIKETCEKTDLLYDSSGESGESVSDIINKFFSNREDEDIVQCLKTFDTNKYPDLQEEWTSVTEENKSGPELCLPSSEKDRMSVESVKKDNNLERPKSRRGIEETATKIMNHKWKKTKSSEDSKIIDGKQEFRTKSLSGDIQWKNILRDDSHGGRTPKERKTVNFEDECKLGSKTISSSFFCTHKNVGFIGKEADEEYVSFDVGQVTFYQPHENQMLLYDIANCAATQGYLKMCGITYDIVIRKNAEQMSPSGKVPFISSSLCIIPEFEAIVSFMQYKKFACIPVKESDKPTFRAFISMIVDILETAERYICWYDDATLLNYTRPRIGGQYPFPLNHIMHWKKRHEERCRLSERGYTGKSFQLILREINSCFQTLSRRLGNNNFFFGNVGTEVDALVYGHVYALFTPEVDGPLRDVQFIIQQYPNLVSFACNFDKTFCLEKFSSIQQSYWDNIFTRVKYPNEMSLTTKV